MARWLGSKYFHVYLLIKKVREEWGAYSRRGACLGEGAYSRKYHLQILTSHKSLSPQKCIPYNVYILHRLLSPISLFSMLLISHTSLLQTSSIYLPLDWIIEGLCHSCLSKVYPLRRAMDSHTILFRDT